MFAVESINLKDLEELPLDVVQHVLWHFGDSNLGLEPGTFTARLLLTMSAADRENFARLHLAYPNYGFAFHAVGRVDGGLEKLRSIASAVFA